MKKFLIIRFSSIGDIVLTTPVLRCLKQQHDDCEVHYLTKKQFAPVLAANPFIDKIYTIKESIGEILPALRSEAYAQIIDLHKNLRSIELRMKLGLTATTFPKLNLQKFLLVNLKVNRMPDVHIVDRYFEAVKNLGIVNDLKGLDYFIPKEVSLSIESLPKDHQKGYVGLVIGGKHKTKQLPVDRVIELCRRIDFPFLLLGGPDDEAEGEIIAKSNPEKIFNAAGKFSLNQSALLVQKAKLIITNDTGLMHVAAAFHKKIISIWGNTVPELGMYPYLPEEPEKNSIFEVEHLSCRPCSKIGFEKCPKGHFKCMNLQNLDRMVVQAKKFLQD